MNIENVKAQTYIGRQVRVNSNPPPYAQMIDADNYFDNYLIDLKSFAEFLSVTRTRTSYLYLGFFCLSYAKKGNMKQEIKS